MNNNAILALENGMIFRGRAFGDMNAEAKGEVVFNTSITGYQEVISDPSYKGQIMTFTYPHIGNYGVNPADFESDSLKVEGIIVKECSRTYSNYRATGSLQDLMKEQGRIGIQGLDTRQLVRILRSEGVMRGIISAQDKVPKTLIEEARSIPSMEGLDLTLGVTCNASYVFEPQAEELIQDPLIPKNRVFRIAAIDYGIKHNILRRLAQYGCHVTVFPAHAKAEEILAINPEGIFLSNGPGDPAAAVHAIETISLLVKNGIPTFGICLGHQLLGLVFGAKTYKLRFGHRGANHPVKNLLTGDIEITSQNHGFAVDQQGLPAELEATHINLNDNTLSGIRHRELPVFSVQYHPEAAPGPHDSDYLFKQFIEMMSAEQTVSAT
ncbi:MAG: glutamine-hydrolyzing carbamoyl-phosphate synthase small subunit [Ignavibacteria bacterium]|nr:glutamine-hydrolyzing carbamoyl-phosphate synthase small subunit [Ignavibacteria bacterium]